MTKRYLTVTALTKYLKKKIDIDPHLREFWLKGEISNFSHHSRGHMYFTLKDENARIQSVMFAGNNQSLKFKPENGMKVIIKGEVSVFEPYGQYQLYVKEMEPDGIGALYLAYEQLKENLKAKGYFDPIHKKAIPSFPKEIAIITSPTGAAVRDILTTVKRRYPYVQTTIIPVIVQGETAPGSIVKALKKANELAYFDTIILARGGGSIEDLWGFNDESVAEAVFHSSIPIISGVGHETDTTITDFIADLRAPTPTGAAELAVPDTLKVKEKLAYLQAQMTKLAQIQVLNKKERWQRIMQSYVFHKPKQLLNEKEQYIDTLTDKLAFYLQNHYEQKRIAYKQLLSRLHSLHPNEQIKQAKSHHTYVKGRLQQRSEHILSLKQHRLAIAIEKLTLLNPLLIMQRGYTVTYNEQNEMVTSVRMIKEKDKIQVQFIDGTIDCRVDAIRKDAH